MSQMDNSSCPLLSPCRLACFRALTSELIISRSAAFLIAVVSPRRRRRRQSIDQASTTRSRSPDRPRPVAATIIFVLIWEEKSRGRERTQRSRRRGGGGGGGDPRTCDQPPYIVPRLLRWFRWWPRGERRVDWTIRHLTGQTRQLGAIQMRTRRKRGAKERWTANLFK